MLTSSTALFKTHITLWSAHEHAQYLPFYPDVAGGVLQSAAYIKKCRVYSARLPPSPRTDLCCSHLAPALHPKSLTPGN